ncbi:MAG: hypothetical protein HFJ92_08810 [Muribaculaceae bacterium]|nr:hypothetical protein [Muribaculaceae bacterium]
MSKTTVKKSLEGFDAPQLRQFILDLYAKSKEAKEILDFYAVPDINKKLEEYKKPVLKEAWRYTRRAHHPRIPRIRAQPNASIGFTPRFSNSVINCL